MWKNLCWTTDYFMKFIDVTGYFYSGSSAVVDLIREYDDIYECKAEIR